MARRIHSGNGQLKLARVQALNQRLYCDYLLSQQLREIYRAALDQAIALLEAWLKWARRSRYSSARAHHHRDTRNSLTPRRAAKRPRNVMTR
jgi:hypothetical protein